MDFYQIFLLIPILKKKEFFAKIQNMSPINYSKCLLKLTIKMKMVNTLLW